MGEFSRLAAVFFEPSKAFEDIARRPTWLLPLLLTIVAGIAYYTTFGQHVTWERFQQHQEDTSPKVRERMEQIPAEKRADARATTIKFMGIGYDVGVAVFTPIVLVISSALVLAFASMMSAGVRFKQVWAVEVWATVPIIIKHALAIVVMFLKSPDDFNLINPLAFNPAAFMDPVTSSKFLYTIAMSVDVFTIWTLLLAATGLKAAAGKRLSFAGALVAVVVPFALFVLLSASIAGAFS